MSEAKGPYTTEPCERHAGRLKIVFYKGMISCGDRHNQQVSCDALNEAWEIGRASRDGLREALISISRNTCCEQCQQAKLVAMAALEADGEGKNE